MTRREEHYRGTRCPHCDARATHEWNGQKGVHASYLCTRCREIWDAEHYASGATRDLNRTK